MQKLKRVYRIAFILFALSLLIGMGLLIYISNPHPQSIKDSVGSANILFETSNNTIFSDDDCYTVHWDSDGIKGIYLNGKGKVGQGEESVCYKDHHQPKLRVVFQDDTEETYQLDIVVIQHQSIFWIGLGIVGILLFFSAYFFVVPFLGVTLESRKSIVFTIINLIVLTVLTLVVVFGVLEVGMRYYFTNFGTEVDRIAYIYSREDIQEQTTQFSGVPYVLFVPNPNYEGHNQLGYRGKETTVEKPEGIFRIVTIGESTTYGFGVNANEAYPALLEDILREEYGYTNVEVINAGVVGYTSFEVLSNFQFRVLELKPDLIIYYGALNDADTRLEDPGCFNSPSPLYGLTTIRGLWRTEFAELPSSVLYRYFGVNVGFVNVPTSIEFALEDIPLEKECELKEKFSDEQLIEMNQPKFVGRNFRNLIGLAQFNDIDVMVSGFVYPTTLEQVDGDEKLLMSPARRQAVIEVNDLFHDIAEELNVHYYALEQDYVIEPGMFWTVVHMRASGTKQQAKLYAQYLVENNLIPSPESNE